MTGKGLSRKHLGLRHVIPVSLFLSLVTTFLFAVSAGGDIYRFIDNKGIIHFTNVPTYSDYRYSIYLNESSDGIACLSNHEYDTYIAEAARKHLLPFSLIKALIKVESDFDPIAVSRSGALGLMQIMPDTLKELNIINPFDPRENVLGGSLYLKRLIKRFDGNMPLALAAYNAGGQKVIQYKGIPPFPETQGFVRKVMQYFMLPCCAPH